MKPVIGIVTRRGISELDGKVLDIGENYRLAIVNSGGIPLGILPTQSIIYNDSTSENTPKNNDENIEDLFTVLKKCDGILMTGGNKIFEYDELICKYALENDIPLLGICMGMQVMAVVDNNSYQVLEEIKTEINHKQLGCKSVHKVILDENSKLYSLINKKEILVNSAHKYMINKVNNFNIIGYSEDGIIEAIENSKKRFALGIQWHPERIYENEEEKAIFDKFIESCKR